MSFSTGDKVKARTMIPGGLMTWDIPQGTPGIVTSRGFFGNTVKVRFTISGMFGDREDERDVEPAYLEKRW